MKMKVTEKNKEEENLGFQTKKKKARLSSRVIDGVTATHYRMLFDVQVVFCVSLLAVLASDSEI
jgi:hypothetical protein